MFRNKKLEQRVRMLELENEERVCDEFLKENAMEILFLINKVNGNDPFKILQWHMVSSSWLRSDYEYSLNYLKKQAEDMEEDSV